MGSPTTATWPEGLALAERMGFRWPHCPPVSLSKLVRACSQVGVEPLGAQLLWLAGFYTSVAGVTLCQQCSCPPGLVSTLQVVTASPEAIELMTAMCAWDPKRRPTAVQALQHPYFQARWAISGCCAGLMSWQADGVRCTQNSCTKADDDLGQMMGA